MRNTAWAVALRENSMKTNDRKITDLMATVHSGKTQLPDFQRGWVWDDERYHLIQYIIDDEETLQISKFECDYRATRRDELTSILLANRCSEVAWIPPADSGFYQPIVVARK